MYWDVRLSDSDHQDHDLFSHPTFTFQGRRTSQHIYQSVKTYPNTSGATTAVTNILLEFCLWCYLRMEHGWRSCEGGTNNKKKKWQEEQQEETTHPVNIIQHQHQHITPINGHFAPCATILGIPDVRNGINKAGARPGSFDVHSEGFPQPNLVGKDIPFHWNALKRNMLSNSVSKQTWCSASVSSTVHVAGDFRVGFSLSNTNLHERVGKPLSSMVAFGMLSSPLLLIA